MAPRGLQPLISVGNAGELLFHHGHSAEFPNGGGLRTWGGPNLLVGRACGFAYTRTSLRAPRGSDIGYTYHIRN